MSSNECIESNELMSGRPSLSYKQSLSYKIESIKSKIEFIHFYVEAKHLAHTTRQCTSSSLHVVAILLLLVTIVFRLVIAISANLRVVRVQIKLAGRPVAMHVDLENGHLHLKQSLQ